MVVSVMTKGADRVVVEHGTEGAAAKVTELEAAGYGRQDKRRVIETQGKSTRVYWI